MAVEVLATDAQQALFREWAGNTSFVVDIHDSPKRQFNILAQIHGWVGGGELWNTNWLKCFDQVYTWRGIGHALDAESDVSERLLRNIWTQHDGFVPDPTADFDHDFDRLSQHMGWDNDERNQYRPEYLAADFESFYGTDSKSLPNWQHLCEVVGISPAPATIEECSDALKKKLLNIFNVVNNRRTGERIRHFPTKHHFIKYTWPARTYPLDLAKQGTLMACLLKPVSRKGYNALADREYAEYLAHGGI